jgi:hypothetical protein
MSEPLEAIPAVHDRLAGQLWRGRELARVPAHPTGWAALDARLPGGGWPVGALIEMAPLCEGLGEVSLLMPALKDWCDEGRSIGFVNPPHIPYAPALVRSGLKLRAIVWIAPRCDGDALWAAEQMLRAGAAAVLVWSEVQEDRALRRLQLAAENGKSCAFLYRCAAWLRNASPAAVRLLVLPAEGGVTIQLLKVRGGHAGELTVPLSVPPQ